MEAMRWRLRIFVLVFLFIMFLGTLGFVWIEGLSPVDAFYFSLVTVTTVGYGDIHPVSQTGKILAIIMILSGVGTFMGVVANATEMLLTRREKNYRTQKIHMVTGLFFSEVGTRLLEYFIGFDPNLDHIRKDLIVTGDWREPEFIKINDRIRSHSHAVDIQKGSLEGLRIFLDQQGHFLLRLLENPALLEHEHLTELLRAVFHLREELLHREHLMELPQTDYAHLAGDIKRAYGLLTHEWFEYMKYLKGSYPYLFSLAMRTNPFNPETSAVVKQ